MPSEMKQLKKEIGEELFNKLSEEDKAILETAGKLDIGKPVTEEMINRIIEMRK